MQQLAAQLTNLDIFSDIKHISPINSGLSGHSFKVETQGRLYFAKSLQRSNTAHIELQVHQQAAIKGLSPTICYADQNWLITDFIQGDELSKAKLSIEDKLAVAVTIMYQFHQVSTEPLLDNLPRLAITKTINDLLATSLYSAKQIELITQIGEKLAHSITVQGATVCHGDINFTNVLLSDNGQLLNAHNTHYLIDFECACLADVEYDIAMLLAINTIDKHSQQSIISHYETLSKRDNSLNINTDKVTCYLSFCYLINGLWFYGKYKHKQDKKLLHYANTQFNLFDQLDIFKVKLSQQMR